LTADITTAQRRFDRERLAQEHLMNSSVRLFASIIALTALGGCYAQAGYSATASAPAYEGEYVETEEAPPAPPPPPPEPIPVAPSPDHVWIEGNYGWHAHVYTWNRGRYEHRPHARANWVGGHWEKRGRRRMWVDGHWN
jgi:hypothetical protein